MVTIATISPVQIINKSLKVCNKRYSVCCLLFINETAKLKAVLAIMQFTLDNK